MNTTNIYTLTDPITNEVRYVGKANDISQRYKSHLNGARKHQIHKKNWINSLKKLKLKPIIDVIDIVPINEWVFWETYWISQFKSWGCNLINYTMGGDGCTFANQTSFKKGENTRAIVALTKTGEFVKEFTCIKEGEQFCGKKCVDSALLRNIKSAGGYLWLYKDIYNTITTNELKDFINWCNTKKEFKANSGCFKKGSTSLNKDKKLSELTKEKIKKTRFCKPVLQFTKTGSLIKEHRSIEDAMKFVNGYGSGIRNVCNNKPNYKTAYGYIWKFK